MADEERSEEPVATRRRSSAKQPEVEYQPIDGKSEAQARIEADAKRRNERAEAEWKEYQEMRREEKEREEREIKELRERRDQRRKERAEEEKRQSEQRAIEDQKRRAEDEERQRRKKEEEARKREEREKKRLEAEERTKQQNKKPNFVISKRPGLIPANNEGEEPTKEEIAKSKEQLEAERKAVLEQRVQQLNTNGLSLQQLQEKAKELHTKIYNLESEKYDLTQQFQRQNMDLMELAERARQMNKGGKEKKVNMSQQDAFSSTMSRAPPKIVMYSQYERVKDPRNFNERQTCFTGSMYGEEYTRVMPQHKVEMGDQGAVVTGEYQAPTGDTIVNGVPEPAEVPVA